MHPNHSTCIILFSQKALHILKAGKAKDENFPHRFRFTTTQSLHLQYPTGRQYAERDLETLS